MENLFSTMQVVELTFFVGAFYHNSDKVLTDGNLAKLILRILDITVLIGAVYLTFINNIWWKSIIIIVLLFLASSFVGSLINRHLNRLIIFIIAVIGLFFTAFNMYLKIF